MSDDIRALSNFNGERRSELGGQFTHPLLRIRLVDCISRHPPPRLMVLLASLPGPPSYNDSILSTNPHLVSTIKSAVYFAGGSPGR